MNKDNLRVELTHRIDGTVFYGNKLHTIVLDETVQSDFDKRDDICPIGVHLVLNMTNGDRMELTATAGFFDSREEGDYNLFFRLEESIYELFVHINDYDDWDVYLYEYLTYESFEDGDADNQWSKDNHDFEVCEPYGERGVIKNIAWETDGEDVKLPNTVFLPAHIDGDDDVAVADYLSDTYGWLVSGYDIEKK